MRPAYPWEASNSSARSLRRSLAANLPVWTPEIALRSLCRRAIDWYLMSEDLPSAESRVYLDGGRIVLDWQPTNLKAHGLLVDRMRRIFRRAGYQLIVTKPFGSGDTVASVRYDSNGSRPSDGSTRSLLQKLRPPEPVRRRRELPAEFGCREPVAHHCCSSAARCKSLVRCLMAVRLNTDFRYRRCKKTARWPGDQGAAPRIALPLALLYAAGTNIRRVVSGGF